MENNYLKKGFVSIMLFFLLFNCAPKNENLVKPREKKDLSFIYNSAYVAFEKGNYNQAVDLFKIIQSDYSFSEWSPKSMLMIAYIYYEVSEYEKSLEELNRFRKLYPFSKYKDYTDYLIAMIFFEQIDDISKDQSYANSALTYFNNILNIGSSSAYYDDSRFKVDLIYEQFAGKEMYLARYYINKKKWIPAIQKLNIIVKKYQKTIYIEEALHRLVEIHYHLGNIKNAEKYTAILGYNYNSSEWYKKSYSIIQKEKYVKASKKPKKSFKDRIKLLLLK